MKKPSEFLDPRKSDLVEYIRGFKAEKEKELTDVDYTRELYLDTVKEVFISDIKKNGLGDAMIRSGHPREFALQILSNLYNYARELVAPRPRRESGIINYELMSTTIQRRYYCLESEPSIREKFEDQISFYDLYQSYNTSIDFLENLMNCRKFQRKEQDYKTPLYKTFDSLLKLYLKERNDLDQIIAKRDISGARANCDDPLKDLARILTGRKEGAYMERKLIVDKLIKVDVPTEITSITTSKAIEIYLSTALNTTQRHKKILEKTLSYYKKTNRIWSTYLRKIKKIRKIMKREWSESKTKKEAKRFQRDIKLFEKLYLKNNNLRSILSKYRTIKRAIKI